MSLLGTPREWAKDLGLATVIGLFLGIIGPFGSFNSAPVEIRAAYWVANMWVGFIVLSTVLRVAIKLALRFDLPVWFALAFGVAIGSAPLAFLLILLSHWMWLGAHHNANPFLVWYGQTLALSEPCCFGYYLLGVRRRAQTAPTAADPSPEQPVIVPQGASSAFVDRLPPRLGRGLLCLQMEDHYVRAHTALGSDLILIPLKAAVAELGKDAGLQVHRSWWVAKTAVSAPVANGRNLSLKLINGLEVPVSRASVAKLRAAGWI